MKYMTRTVLNSHNVTVNMVMSVCFGNSAKRILVYERILGYKIHNLEYNDQVNKMRYYAGGND